MNADAEVEVAIVGAGPQGLAAALHLLDRDPALVDELVVVDPAGWMGTWRDHFGRLDIAHLRSPGVHHPSPDPHAFGKWSDEHDCSSGLPYSIPTTEAFDLFCDHLVRDAGLAEHVVPTRARRLVPGQRRSILHLDDGTTIAARHVIVAVNPARRQLPHWVFQLPLLEAHRFGYADDVDLRTLDLTDERVAVVGGGLTAAHLAIGAIRRGGHVTICSRRPLRESMFDTDPGWLGPKSLDHFHSLRQRSERCAVALAARDGGSIPPWMTRQLRDQQRHGRLEQRTEATIVARLAASHDVELRIEDDPRPVDRIWLATGTVPDVRAHRLTRFLCEDHPTEIIEGWPVLDEQLRWPGTNVHLLGRPAMLEIGPAAGNLWGCRVGASIVADHICTAGSRFATRTTNQP